jgi:MraZ protein
VSGPPALTVPEPPRPMFVARLPLAPPLQPEGGVALQAPQCGGWSQPVPMPQTEPEPSPRAEVIHTARTVEPPALRPLPALAASPLAAPAPAGRKPGPLTGTHPCTLTDEHGLTLPKRLRQQFGDRALRTLYAAPGPDQSVWLYTAAGLERLNEQLGRSPAGDSRIRQARRLCFAQAEECGVDRSGHVNLPEHLVQYAGLQQEVVLLGVGDHLEVWDARRWQEYLQKRAPEKATAERGENRAATQP